MTGRREEWWRPPPLPREHGAWAMLVLPLALGAVASRGVSAAAAWIVPATVLLFLARFAGIPRGTLPTRGAPLLVPPDARRRLWTPVYLAGSVACLLLAIRLAPAEHRGSAVALAAATGALGGANAALVLLGRGRTVLAEVLAMAGVAATAPLVMALAGTPFGPRPAGVGAICLAYFLSTIAVVRASRRRGGDERAWRSGVRACVAVHAALVLALPAMWRAGWLAPGLLVAFVPVLLRTAWGLARPTKNLRVLGWREMGVAAAFLAAAGVAVWR